jgi:phenylacetate-coenzyme A ligase PaaK-like adenylate-forming protein
VHVEGRKYDTLIYRNGDREVTVMALALITLLSSVSGIEPGYQIVQTAEDVLSFRMQFSREADATWAEVARRVRSHLRARGLPHVSVELSPIPPRRDPRTGKLHKIWSEVPVSSAL